ncbi:hypothetical protein Hypma_000090 [Hypsizygus marmoreus]|uniref:DUF1748-domain-containing protein n=1 Tax=Hypsizygus marmoreus TaxID=39966 RepID=A0A369K8Y1_HYPMA|nr:hypothetical protein Hypma_000090 [Hypsizygus marmoreus]
MALGRLIHYAFDAALISTVIAGVKRSSGLSNPQWAKLVGNTEPHCHGCQQPVCSGVGRNFRANVSISGWGVLYNKVVGHGRFGKRDVPSFSEHNARHSQTAYNKIRGVNTLALGLPFLLKLLGFDFGEMVVPGFLKILGAQQSSDFPCRHRILAIYEGNAGDAAICKYNPDGTLVGGQGGCWNAPSMCTEGVSMGQGGTGAASFSFNGSAIYINSLLNYFSPIYTVTLDGQSTEVDGVRPSGVFICAPLFSQTGLDPEVEHTIRLSVKGASPTRNTTRPNSENSFAFSVISFVYTEGPVGNTTKNSSAGVNSTTTTSGGNSAQTSAPSSAEAPQLSARLVLAIVLAMGWSVLS